MSNVKITDLVPQETINKIKELDEEIRGLLDTYTDTAKELAKGVDIKVRVIGDIDKLEKLLVDKSKEAADAGRRLNNVMAEQSRIVANTTNTISRQLMEQEKVNKAQRETYTEHEKVKNLLDRFHDTYENQTRSLAKITQQLAENKKAQSDNEKALAAGLMTMEQFTGKQAALIAQHRSLTQEKRTLTQIMTAEEKAAQSQEGSYVHMSQQLELLKKAYKDLSEEGRNADFGKELEASIQNLDAHLKDVAADMGEFQRNVGNYAIAGQNGVVSTESLMAAMNQEARTTQDLIDQTKILEDAKRMLNTSDENYEQTLAQLNEKIEENKRSLSDVSDIIDKDATSIAEAEAQNKRLQEALKHVDLSSDDAQATIEKLNKKIAENTQLIKDNTPAIQEQTSATEDRTKANKDAADELLGLVGINTNFGESLQGLSKTNAGGVMDGLGTKAKALGNTLMGMLSNPWVLAFLGIVGVAAGFKWWYDYNKGLVEASKLTRDFTGLTGDAMKAARNEVQAVADMYDKDFREVLESANAMSKQFGISFQESMRLIEDGFVAGADVNGEFLENIKEYPAYFREAGLSASEFIAITTQANQAGIYSDKGIDVIKEGNLRIREMTKATAEALEGIGISSKQVQQDLADGSKTTFNIMQEVSEKLAEFPESSSEVGTALADIFGGPGEDAGLQYILTLKDIDKNLDNVKDRAGELGELQEEQLRSQIELENTIAAVFDTTGGSFERLTTKAKVFINDGIINIIKGCVDIVNWFIRMYNKSIVVRGAVNSIVNSFKTMWEVAKFILNQIVDSFKAMGTVIEGVVTLDWDKVSKGWKDGMNALKGNVETMARNIASNTAQAFNNTMDDELKEVSIDLNANLPANGVAQTGQKPKSGYTPRESEEEKKAREKAAKEAEKQAKEELKRLHELEESKIAVMADGHEKELAMIRLKFKKKIDEIKGDGETENALRVQLAEQCQKEIADCELKYQTELAKINLENRLASIEEGSKEELDLKLAQLEATRAAELKAAEKTGADVALINDKFNKERLELEEEYANNLADKITERYGVEEIIRNQEYSNAVNALKERYAKEMALAEKYAGLREDLEEEHSRKLIEKNAAEFAEAQSDRDNNMMAELVRLQSRYAAELELAGSNEAKRAQIKARYEAKSAEIAEKYAIQSAQASVNMFEGLLKNSDLTTKDREKIEKDLAAARIKLEKAVTDHVLAENERKELSDEALKEKRIKNTQQWLQVASNTLNGISDLMSAVSDAKIEQIENEQEAVTKASESEIANISQLVEKKVITEEEGEARKRAAEAQTAKKNEELEKKKQQLKQKQAVWDKANSIAQAAIATALAITQALPNVVLAAIAGAMGALQIATIVATPIPKYAKGTDYHKGGPAIVGDGGRHEVVMFNGDTWLTPDKPTLVDIPAGASVLPDVSMLDMEMPGLISLPENDRTAAPVVVNNDYSRLERGIRELAGLIRAQTRQQKEDAANARYELFKQRI